MKDATEPKAQPDHAGVFLPPPLFYVAAFLAGLVVQWFAPIGMLPEGIATMLGNVSAITAFVLASWSFATFLRSKTSFVPIKPATTLVSTGPFRYTRNPMYLSLALLYLGVALWMDALWPLLFLAPLLFIIQACVIAREERYLERKFGEEYRLYKARVRRWL